LLPPAERAEPDPLAAADALATRLRLLDAIRRGAAALLARPRLGEGRLPRGAPEALPVEVRAEYRPAGLAELFGAYGGVMRRGRQVRMTFPRRRLDSVKAALERLSRQLTGVEWCCLMRFLPPGLGGSDGDGDGGLGYRSAVAASLVAGLELARAGAVELAQAFPFGPVMVRRL
jgi:segregation and condensation protein A